MSTSVSPEQAEVLGAVREVGELYARSAAMVRHSVRGEVAACEAVVDDACQFAWGRLLHHHDRVRRDRAVSWLITTALHEAFKLIRRADRDVSLEHLVEETGDLLISRTAPGPEEVVEPRIRLELLGELPERQERLVWLQGLGFDYREIAGQTGMTIRSVDRQLVRARRALRRTEGADA